MDINAFNGLKGAEFQKQNKKNAVTNAGDKYPSFKDTLSGMMNDVNKMQSKADESIKKVASGEITDVNQVMNSVEEAKLAFNMMMEIRTKVMEAYKEVMRMRL